MTRLKPTLTSVFLAGADLVLASALVLLWDAEAEVPKVPARPGSVPEAQVPEVEELGPGPLDLFNGMMSRPLFWETRRPPPEPEEDPDSQAKESKPEPPPSLDGVRLIGVVSGNGQTLALIDQGGKVSRVKPGEQVNGWKVTAINADRVQLEHGDNENSLRLFVKEESKKAEQGPRSRGRRRSIRREAAEESRRRRSSAGQRRGGL